MQLSINKAKTAAPIVLVLLMASVMLMANEPIVSVKAAEVTTSGPPPAGVTPALTTPTLAFLSFRPNPVGVGQPILVNAWITPSGPGGRIFRDYKFTFTKPDGDKTVFTINAEPATACIWFEWPMDQVGEWKIKFEFPGLYCNGTTSANQSIYYMPSSTAEYTLTVQQDIVYSWPPSPLPTDYWTRPVFPTHREWWLILGNWPWSGPGGGPVWDELYPNTNIYVSNYKFTPYVQGPNTAHIVWKRQSAITGLIGGIGGTVTNVDEIWYFPSIIYAGRAYESITKPGSGKSAVVYWMCYDIRTGELIWERPLETGESAPTVIEYVGKTINFVYIGGGWLRKYSPFTGAMSLNVSISPLTTGTYYMNGYALTVQDLGTAVPVAERYRLINWTTTGTSSTLAARIRNNITWPFSSIGTVDYETGIAVTTASLAPPGVGVSVNVHVSAASMTTGKLLWNVSSGVDYALFSGSTAVADHGKFAVLFGDGHWYCWDLASGKRLWQGEQSSWPWCAFAGYNVASYGGMIISSQYDCIAALDWNTGKIVWTYASEAPYPYETPYTGAEGQAVYSWHSGGIIVDGKLYMTNAEHTATSPVTRGWRLHCINITTGKGIWNITAFNAGGRGFQGSVADGYMTCWNAYNGHLYCYGKGISAATVTAPDTSVPLGTAVLIKGTVLDQSPAQSGTPCVSKESMTTYMEYLHMQGPIAGLWGNETITGVPVNLLATAEDGTYIDIGTVTTNGYYGTFAKEWTPPAEGTYEIIATFAGDDSYGSSGAATAVTVGPAPATPSPTPEPPEAAPDNTPLMYGILLGVIAAIVIGLIALFRKR